MSEKMHEAAGAYDQWVAGDYTQPSADAAQRSAPVGGDNIYNQPMPTEDPRSSNAYRAPLTRMEPPGIGHSLTLGPVVSEERANLNGVPTISDTYNPRDQGTDWPPDSFTALVAGHESPLPITRPALHSYDGDGNMEALSVLGPFTHQEHPTDLAMYTGAPGPLGRSTPEQHPELTAP